jgi:FtsP/CotA-like multicopper oxidase with cupredoxin domain
MRKYFGCFILVVSLLFIISAVRPATGAVFVQCPGDTNGDAQWTGAELPAPANTACMHIIGSDGFATMADGRVSYIFGFSDGTGFTPDQVLVEKELGAQISAPLIRAREGDDFYLTLSTAPMKVRPDLFDPHSIHWHGFPNAGTVFDGEPMASLTPNPGTSFTYYYQVPGPGTYMYHCHVEASEHMQMGMLGNLYVTPLQDQGPPIGGFSKFAYNDTDGSTGYHVDYPLQITAFDHEFHDANQNVQPLPFAAMADRYSLLNGRGYPDTINPSLELGRSPDNNNKIAQPVPARITSTAGQRIILLRISSLSTIKFYTLMSPSIPMRVVGKDAALLRGTTGSSLYYTTNTVTLGGGESMDVILDTTGIPAGTYFLYTSGLNDLSNYQEDFGGMMTEIVVQ